MKKILGLLVVLTFLTTGCLGRSTPQKELVNAINKMEKLDNYTMKMEMTLEGTIKGEPVEYKIEETVDIDQKNNKTKSEYKADYVTSKSQLRKFTQKENEEIIEYSQNLFGDGWVKKEVMKDYITNLNMEELKNLFSNTTNITKKKSKYEMTIDINDFKKITIAGDTILEADKLSIKGEFNLIVTIEDGYIKSIKTIFDESYKLDYIITFENFNEIEFTIPSEILKKALFR